MPSTHKKKLLCVNLWLFEMCFECVYEDEGLFTLNSFAFAFVYHLHSNRIGILFSCQFYVRLGAYRCFFNTHTHAYIHLHELDIIQFHARVCLNLNWYIPKFNKVDIVIYKVTVYCKASCRFPLTYEWMRLMVDIFRSKKL